VTRIADGSTILGKRFERVAYNRYEQPVSHIGSHRGERTGDEPCCLDVVLLKQLQKALRPYRSSPETL
jgi:hypothetical protein